MFKLEKSRKITLNVQVKMLVSPPVRFVQTQQERKRGLKSEAFTLTVALQKAPRKTLHGYQLLLPFTTQERLRHFRMKVGRPY